MYDGRGTVTERLRGCWLAFGAGVQGGGGGRGALCTELAANFAICDCDAHRGPQKLLAISDTLLCDF